MNWFQTAIKRIFCSQEEFNKYGGLPASENFFPESCKVKKPKPDISEPVYVMVQSMFDRPHTWKIERDDTLFFHPFTHFNIKDIKTGVEFKVTRYSSSYGDRYNISCLSWATDEEGRYLCTGLETMHKLKMGRVERIREVKKNIERNKVKELYK